MATTTPNFGWVVPTSTDLVKDGATAIETLGDSIDASMAELKGGTTGQVLSKTSNTDMDFTWVAQDDSNAIQNAIVDAKGDLIGATAADTPARLAVGTNGQVLTADSTAATGLKWATATSSVTFAGCRATRSAAASITNATLTALNWDGETFDTDAFHSTSSNTNRITIPAGKAGYYEVNFATEWTDANATGRRLTVIQKNGSDVIGFESTPSSSATLTYYGANVMNLAVADYVSVAVLNTSGSTLNVGTGSYFGITYLGA